MLTVAARLKKLFDFYRIHYQFISHERTISLAQAQECTQIEKKYLIRVVVLKDEQAEYLLAVLPLDYSLDFACIYKRLRRNFQIASRLEMDRIFFDCEPGSHPPFGEPYGIKTIIDSSLEKLPFLYFEPGSHTSIVKLSVDDYQFLNSHAIWTKIATPETIVCPDSLAILSQRERERAQSAELELLVQQLEHLYPIPHLPETFRKLLSQNWRTDQSFHELAALLYFDCEVRQAFTEPFEEEAHSLEVFAFRLKKLGMQTAQIKAIHYFLNALFFVQKNGPLGFNAFWRHATVCANLMQMLAIESNNASLDPALAYQCGLFHNIGLLLLGHLFPPEFCLLNKMFAQAKNPSIEMLEKKLLGLGLAQKMFGCGHAWLGSKLLEYWQLPEPLITTAREHHHLTYRGVYQEYVYLQIIANTLLKYQNIGDGMTLSFTELPLQELGLSTSLLNEYLEKKNIFTLEEEPIVEI